MLAPMEFSVWSIAFSVFMATICLGTWKVLNWVWFKPKKMENHLRKQGFNGNSYKLLFGDMKESFRMLSHAQSKPVLDRSDDIVPRIAPFTLQTVKDHGKNSFIWYGPTPRVNILDPEQIKEIFSKINDFQKPKSNPMARLLSAGLSSYEGEKWVKHRRIINQAFHLEKLKNMLPAFYDSCSKMIGKWENMCREEGKCELDVWPFLENLTGDVISRTAFGSNYEDGRKIFQLQKEQADYTSQALDSVYIPGFRFVPTKTNKRMKEIDKEVRDVVKGIIRKREKATRSREDSADDLLGMLMQINFKETEHPENSNKVGMSIEDIIQECKLFYFAGQVTTSVLLVWTMVLLSRYPDWQLKARQEVLHVFGSNAPNNEGLSHLKVVTKILQEVLRLYPSIVELRRRVGKPIKIKNQSLPAGIEVSIPIILIHHDQDLWGKDANEFNPDRFSGGVLKATKGQASYFPFGLGPRTCVGQNFAMLEAKLAVSMILQNFSFELSSTYVHAPISVLALMPQYGAQMILKKL